LPDGWTTEEVARLLPVWDELASLFLDTDYLGIVGPATIAERLRKSGLSADELERILLDEVLPAFAFNLRDVAGEWAAWHPDFLVERMTQARSWSPMRRSAEAFGFRGGIEKDWAGIRRHLPWRRRIRAGDARLINLASLNRGRVTMKKLVLLGAAVLLASCNKAEAPADTNAADVAMPADENVAMEANAAAPAAVMSLLNTSWEYQFDGEPMVTSVDQAGNFITAKADGTHVDHGTFAFKDGKDCFTSAMGEKLTMCYTATPEVAVGSTVAPTDDKAGRIHYKRVE